MTSKREVRPSHRQPTRLCWLPVALLLAACSSRSPQRTTEAHATTNAEPPEEIASPAGGGWYTVAEDELAAVRVERRLYQRAGDPHFLVRVEVDNRADRRLGLDLRDYRAVIYPNQWGALRVDHRSVIDETRAYPELLDAARRADLLHAYATGELVTVAAGGSVDFYREFNASGRAEVDAQATLAYLFVSLAGQALLTDGMRCDNLQAGAPGGSDLIIATPIPWGEVPAGAVIVDESRRHSVIRSAAGKAMVDLAQKSAGLIPGDDETCAGDPAHPHFWSYHPNEAVAEVVEELKSLCIPIGPHRRMNLARWCCPPALP